MKINPFIYLRNIRIGMISIVVPVYNEKENIKPLYEKIRESVKEDFEVIFVDDGSNDGTYEEIKKLHDNGERIKCIRFTRNFGKTAALMAGFDACNGDIVVTIDGDLQNDPEDIPRLVEMLNEYDVVNGWRYERHDPITKRLPSKISNILSRWLTGLNLHDFNCGLKAYKKEVLKDLELYGEMHRYIPAVLAWRGYRVGEIKIKHHKRIHGKSKYGGIRLFRGLMDLINFKFWAGYSTRPLHFFGGVGLSLFLIGFIISFYLLTLKIFYHESLSDRPLLLLGILMILVGLQIFLTGFMAEMVVRSYYSKRKAYIIKEKIE